MNDFTARKMGEVLAFAAMGTETAENGRTTFEQILGQDATNYFLDQNELHARMLEKIAKDNNVSDIMAKKFETTQIKLRAMRDLYLTGSWDNPVEIAEWMSFFEGAASAHWSLVAGEGKVLENIELEKRALDANLFHTRMLATFSRWLHDSVK